MAYDRMSQPQYVTTLRVEDSFGERPLPSGLDPPGGQTGIITPAGDTSYSSSMKPVTDWMGSDHAVGSSLGNKSKSVQYRSSSTTAVTLGPCEFIIIPREVCNGTYLAFVGI